VLKLLQHTAWWSEPHIIGAHALFPLCVSFIAIGPAGITCT
jgi:hypothetical protein